jgi:hypothetical protein
MPGLFVALLSFPRTVLTLKQSTEPTQVHNLFPYIVATWLVVGLGIVLLVPGLARRIGANLAEREGLAVEET